MRKLSMLIGSTVLAIILGACGAQAPANTGETAPTTDSIAGQEAPPLATVPTIPEVPTDSLATADSLTEATAESGLYATPDPLTGATAEGGGGGGVAATSTVSDVVPVDVVELLERDGRFTTLVTAIRAAGLETQLQDIGPFTVFAPTDEAFAGLPQQQLTTLLGDPVQLADILLYHVASQQLLSDDIVQAQTIETIQGTPIRVSEQGGAILLNNSAAIIGPNLRAANGVIHAIDAVLIPAT